MEFSVEEKKKSAEKYMGPLIKAAMKSKAYRSRSNYSLFVSLPLIYLRIYTVGSKGDTSRLLKCGHQQIRFLLAFDKHVVVAILETDFNSVRNTDVVVSNEVANFSCFG
jgi:hypothetical protein